MYKYKNSVVFYIFYKITSCIGCTELFRTFKAKGAHHIDIRPITQEGRHLARKH